MKTRMISPTVVSFATKESWYEKISFINDIRWKVREIKSRLKAIFIRKHNIVRMNALNRFRWYDSDTRIFEANFQILVDYVEKELAWMQSVSENKTGLRWYWYRKRHARELALKHLDWEISLEDPPYQSEAAAKVKGLYLWYKDIRPNRPEPFINLPDRDWRTEPAEDGLYKLIRPEDSEYDEALEREAKLEQDQYEEDTQKVIELVRIRQMMWT